jgi:hypothetical protein
MGRLFVDMLELDLGDLGQKDDSSPDLRQRVREKKGAGPAS